MLIALSLLRPEILRHSGEMRAPSTLSPLSSASAPAILGVQPWRTIFRREYHSLAPAMFLCQAAGYDGADLTAEGTIKARHGMALQQGTDMGKWLGELYCTTDSYKMYQN